MKTQKNPLENFQEITAEKLHPSPSNENIEDKKFFLFQIPKNVFSH